MRKIQRGIMPSAATVETKVMVMERLMSPLSSSVQKLEPVPPGQVPSTKRPSLIINWMLRYLYKKKPEKVVVGDDPPNKE